MRSPCGTRKPQGPFFLNEVITPLKSGKGSRDHSFMIADPVWTFMGCYKWVVINGFRYKVRSHAKCSALCMMGRLRVRLLDNVSPILPTLQV